MNRTRKMTLAAAVGTLGLLFQAQSAAAEKKCKEVKATWVDVYTTGSTSSGTVTNGGILNGTTLTAYTSSAFPTPIATTVSYTSDLTITTNQGQLRANLVYLYDFPTGLWTALGHLDPNLGTGKFAGATGFLYFNGRTIGSAPPFTYPAQLTGEICLTGE
jgi:hypothetical protein